MLLFPKPDFQKLSALFLINPNAATQALVELSKDKEPTVRSYAITTLGELPVPAEQMGKVVQTILHIVATDREPEFLATAFRILGQLSMPEKQVESVVKTLLTDAQYNEDSTVRIAAIRALGNCRCQKSKWSRW